MCSALADPTTVDGRRLSGGALSLAVRDAFDRLASGQRMVLLCDSRPDGVLAMLQRDRPGAFDWAPLRERVSDWEVEIQRRPGPVGSRRELREALAWDHERLEALEEAAFAARAAGRLGEARERFACFLHGMRRHTDVEEHLVLPEFESRAGISGERGPTIVMRDEHRAIGSLLKMIAAEIADPEAAVELTRAELRLLLRDHHLKEEQVVYPALDRLLSAEEADALVGRVQAWTRA